jgi:hypothetical protein
MGIMRRRRKKIPENRERTAMQEETALLRHLVKPRYGGTSSPLWKLITGVACKNIRIYSGGFIYFLSPFNHQNSSYARNYGVIPGI